MNDLAPLLEAADEIRLARRIEAGLMAADLLLRDHPAVASVAELHQLQREGCDAWQQFLLANVRLVQTVVAPMARRCDVSAEELFQEGFLGLADAVQRWDCAAGYRFSTYALQWIRRRVVNASVHAGIGIPGSTRTALRAKRVRHLAEELTAELHREATDAELASLVGRSAEWVARMRGLRRHAPLQPDLVADRCDEPDAESDVLALLPGLPWPERQVLGQRFGLDGGVPLPQREAAAALGMSVSTLRRHEARALRRLRGLLTADLAA